MTLVKPTSNEMSVVIRLSGTYVRTYSVHPRFLVGFVLLDL
jgi:hypothetical protein